MFYYWIDRGAHGRVSDYRLSEYLLHPICCVTDLVAQLVASCLLSRRLTIRYPPDTNILCVWKCLLLWSGRVCLCMQECLSIYLDFGIRWPCVTSFQYLFSPVFERLALNPTVTEALRKEDFFRLHSQNDHLEIIISITLDNPSFYW